jgi:hypothetical protein
VRPTQETTRQRQARLRKAILALVGRQQLTEEQILDELDYLASPARIKRQIAHLVGRSHMTRIERPDGTVLYEHWDLTMQRVRALNSRTGSVRVPRRGPRIVA